MKLLELLQEMFGKSYLNKVIGTKTNISKPIKLDKNSPFKLYSDSAFDNPEVLKFIEKKLSEYGPYALSNKNMSEMKNFEMTLRRDLNAKKGKTELGLPEGVEAGSLADKAIKDSAQYKMDQQGVKSLLDENYKPPKTTTLSEDEIADIGARNYSAGVEGKRRAVIRQILLNDTRIDLPENVRKG